MLHTTKILKVLIFKLSVLEGRGGSRIQGFIREWVSQWQAPTAWAYNGRLGAGPMGILGKAPGGVKRYLIQVWDF